MSQSPEQKLNDQEVHLSYSDLKHVFLLGKRKILWVMLLSALVICLFKLTRMPEYTATATFKEKAKASAGIDSKGLSFALFGALNNSESEATSWMRSKLMMSRLAEELNLQAEVEQVFFRDRMLGKIGVNLAVEYATFFEQLTPVVKDRRQDIGLYRIHYPGESRKKLAIKFTSADSFTVLESGKTIGTGAVEVPFVAEDYTFTVKTDPQVVGKGSSYNIVLQPMHYVVNKLLRIIRVEVDKKDNSLLVLTATNHDRHLAAQIVNTLMRLYQDHLRKEQQRVAAEQVDYLRFRQKDMALKLESMLSEYAETLSSDLNTTGFSSSERAMEFVAATQLRYKQKLMEIDMEARRLKRVMEEGENHLDAFVSGENPTHINSLIDEICQLRQQADVIDLALRSMQTPLSDKQHANFEAQLIDLEHVGELKREAKLVIEHLHAGRLPPSDLALSQDSRFTINSWHQRLNKLIDENASENEISCCFDAYNSYALNLLHLLNVQEKTLQEQLRYQQVSQNEFQGIDLETARELYLNYCKDMHSIEESMLQHKYVLQQMRGSDFEICSLGTILTDSVSQEMIGRASKTVLALKDANNRSSREQDRLKEEIAVQKSFLGLHLQQTLQLLGIRFDLIKQKIRDLQNVNLALIHQQISVVEKHLFDFIHSRINALHQEKELILAHQKELESEVNRIPQKWVAEKMIAMEMEGDQKMIDEISKLVETKNIGSNLEVVQSAPVDIAMAEVHPQPPRIFLFAFVGAVVGGFAAFSLLLIAHIAKGIPATEENLNFNGQKVAGTWKGSSSVASLSNNDLGVLRKLVMLQQETAKDPLSLHVLGNGRDYTPALAHLFSMQGFSCLFVPITFDKADSEKGLLQFLKGSDQVPEIFDRGSYKEVAVGGFSRFAHELVLSQRFNDWLKARCREFDHVLLISTSDPTTSEALTLASRCPFRIVTVRDETLTELKPWFGEGTVFLFS